MRIGLVDVDGHNKYPNLALMKISAWHKQQGDIVEFASIGMYDKLYYSKVFTFTSPITSCLYSSENGVYGGTGYKDFNNLPEEVEHICPDYTLYQCEHAYGFLTRGCIRNCPWCIVPKKEGDLRSNADIDEFIGGFSSAVLMDNNVLASSFGLQQIEKIIKRKIKIDFNQGLDARLIAGNEGIAELLSDVKWLSPLRMACDTSSQMVSIEKAVTLLRKHKCTPSNYFIYVLVKDIPDALERVNFLRSLGVDPFCQPYRDFTNNRVDPEAKRFSRWVNHKAIFKSVSWEQYGKDTQKGVLF